jgi:hypothetical protein
MFWDARSAAGPPAVPQRGLGPGEIRASHPGTEAQERALCRSELLAAAEGLGVKGRDSPPPPCPQEMRAEGRG